MTCKSTAFEELDSFISSVNLARNSDEILDILQKKITFLGFERFTYWLRWSDAGREPIAITTYPDKFIHHYLAENYQNHDMVGRVSTQTSVPFVWDEISKFYKITKVQKTLFDESASVGMKSGASVPIHGPNHAQATFSVVSDLDYIEFTKLFNQHRHVLHIMATYVHERIMSLEMDRRLSDVALTKREAEVLSWVAKGKTYWEIGMILNIREDSVKKYMQKIFSVLDVSNNTHAVAKAIVNGLLVP